MAFAHHLAARSGPYRAPGITPLNPAGRHSSDRAAAAVHLAISPIAQNAFFNTVSRTSCRIVR